MKTMTKYFIFLVSLCVLVACGRRTGQVNIEKNGTYYEIEKEVAFYYPDNFIYDASSSAESLHKLNVINTLYFINEEETLYYMSYDDFTDNDVSDKDELYVAQLEQGGATGIVVSYLNLDSGISVYEVRGNYSDVGTKFTHIVYFSPDKVYIYGYVASKDVYEEQHGYINNFLLTLSVLES